MRILYFVQYFNRPHEPGGSRAYQFARAWVREGHQVTVITGAVNHKTLAVPENYRGRLVVREEVEGIRLLRVWSYAGIRGSFRKRLLNFLSYALTAALVGWVRGGPADVIFASSTPLTVGLPGWFNALVRRRPWVFEVRDLWPQSAVVAGVLSGRALPVRLAAWLSRRFYRSAARIVAVTRGIVQGLVDEGVASEKILLVPNGVDDWMLEAAESPVEVEDSPLKVVYCGALGRMNSLPQILDAAAHLRNEPVEIIFIGDGDERRQLEERVRREGLDGVHFVDALSKREAFERLRRAGALVVTTWDVDFQRMVLANKLFDYLAAGRPVIVAAAGEMADLVEEARCGFVVPPEKPEALAEAMVRMAALDEGERRAMGAAGRRYILERYQRRDLAWKVLKSFEEITGGPAAGDSASGAAGPSCLLREVGRE
ncbi:MAG: glycosyltransferase family 4 protein [Acidobacteriota bacterium]|nr:glycosyltransferase family 4 protein [Acidobacteriota bacterium]